MRCRGMQDTFRTELGGYPSALFELGHAMLQAAKPSLAEALWFADNTR